MLRPLVILVLLLLGACQQKQIEHSPHAGFRDELLRMEVDDQALRERTPSTREEMRAAEIEMEAMSLRHTRRLKQIMRRHGWPTRSLVGEDAARAAWLLVQHADHDPAFQRRVLALLEPLVALGEVRASHHAYLWDRTHDPQRYGTQGECTARGVWEPRRIEAPAEVDGRRQAAGIFPSALADYVQMMSEICKERDDLEPPEESAQTRPVRSRGSHPGRTTRRGLST